MLDDQLIQDLEAAGTYAADTANTLRQHGITTYRQLFALIRDETAEAKLRATACWSSLAYVREIVDKRSAVPPLLVALQSTDQKVCGAAAHSLGMLHSRRAVKPLIEIISAKNHPDWVRAHLIQSLCSIEDTRIVEFLRPIMYDQSENLDVRSAAIEWIDDRYETSWLTNWIALLSDPASDIRFWAAYRLSQGFGNITSALAELDRIVAFDHTLPKYWGWHVDREAMLPLETAYTQMWMGYPDNDQDYYTRYHTWLISPAPEYQTYFDQYCKWAEDWSYDKTTPTLPVTLDINPAWLADRLREHWPDVQLNARQPRPQAYLLDWRMSIDDVIFSGALHRDRYAVVATSDSEAVYTFTAWYRSIIAPEQPLFLYEWADIALELRPGMTAREIEAAERLKNDERTFKG